LIVTFSFPPSSPIYFNIVYSFSLIRLKWNNILGTEPEKTVAGAHLRIMCFDKTGTLTEDKVEVRKVIKFYNDKYSEITSEERSNNSLDFKLFASCHTVREFDEKIMGDEIDLKTFLHSGYTLRASTAANICF
jgi:cation-transporting ATPase 13A3/4/5